MAPSDSIRAEQARADSVRVDKLIGEVLANRYQIEQRLGEGAMGSVYKAKHVKVGRPFAVKVLHPRLLEDEKTLQRFEREAELAGRLHHPNVIGVVDVGETSDGLRYMVMDFAEGHDLASLLSEAPMPAERVIHLTRQMLEGLFHAHEEGLIHRDFKPENVIVERDSHGEEVPRIVDFGIAILREGGESTGGAGRLTTNGLVLGTPHYMAPEQAVNDPIDHRIDLFALGIMIYEMLCGKLPFDGHGAEVARANLMLDPPLIADRVPYLEVDPLLEALSRRMMQKKRENRPATAKAAREILDLIVKDREAAAALLNVPLAAARGTKSTQPVAPRTMDANSEGDTFPPPFFREVETPHQAPNMAAAVAVRAQTPARGVVIDNTRTLISEPIGYQSGVSIPVQKNRTRLIAGVLAAIIVLAAISIIAMRRGDEDVPPGAKTPKDVVAIETKPTPQPPVVEVKPAVKVETPPVPVAEAKIDPSPEVKPAPEVKPTPVPKGKVPKQQVKTAPPVTSQIVPPTPTPVKVETPVATPQPEVKKPELPAAYDSGAFKAQWNAVGGELRSYVQANGSSSVSDLQAKYSAINFMSAASSQSTREAARATLNEIHKKLAELKK